MNKEFWSTSPGSAVPGNAAPQCGTDKARSGEQHRGWYSRGYLPHFDSPHVIQHITYRLADSLPRVVLEQMQAEVEASVRGDAKREAELRQRIETYLDAGYGSCVLQVPEIAACVVDTWNHFDGERYRLLEWVVMPNHCHVLIEPFEGVPLGKIVLSWKNYTARFINKYKSRTGVGQSEMGCSGERGSQVWQREYWDRFIRNESHFEAAGNYIVMNPVKAGLIAKPEYWLWSSAGKRAENNGTR
jgi:putative transposase